MKSGTERGAFERKKLRKPDDDILHNIEVRGGGRSLMRGAAGVRVLSFRLEFMSVCTHFGLAKYFRSTVWWVHWVELMGGRTYEPQIHIFLQ